MPEQLSNHLAVRKEAQFIEAVDVTRRDSQLQLSRMTSHDPQRV